MPTNPYVILTVQLFRTQLLAARAAGDGDRAAACEAALRSVLEDEPSGLRGAMGDGPAAAAS